MERSPALPAAPTARRPARVRRARAEGRGRDTPGSTGGTTVTTGSSGAGTTSSGGTAGGEVCGAQWVTDWYCGDYLPQPGECPAGKLEIKDRLINLCGAGNPLTVPFIVADALTAGLVGQTGPCGVFWFCVDAGTEITPVFSAAGFFPIEVATLKAEESSSLTGGFIGPVGLNMFCDTALMLVDGVLDPPIDTAQALVAIGISPGSEGTACDPNTGWSFTLIQGDGGEAQASSAFLVGTGPSQLDAGTSGEGIRALLQHRPCAGFGAGSRNRSWAIRSPMEGSSVRCSPPAGQSGSTQETCRSRLRT